MTPLSFFVVSFPPNFPFSLAVVVLARLLVKFKSVGTVGFGVLADPVPAVERIALAMAIGFVALELFGLAAAELSDLIWRADGVAAVDEVVGKCVVDEGAAADVRLLYPVSPLSPNMRDE